jgi:hypothetical protein
MNGTASELVNIACSIAKAAKEPITVHPDVVHAMMAQASAFKWLVDTFERVEVSATEVVTAVLYGASVHQF